MTRSTRAVGSDWEDAAASALESAGLRILARQYRCRFGEIDLIAADGGTIVFVEVRYRGSSTWGGAAASVTYGKQRRIAAAARHFIMLNSELAERPMRMDVVAFDSTAKPGAARMQWIRDAFAAA